MDNLLYQVCTVKRSNIETNDKPYIDVYNDTVIGTYPCRLMRSSPSLVKQQANSIKTGTMRLYLDMGADIKEGDLIEVEDYSYYTFRASFVYKPNNHHIEVDLEIMPGDV